MLFIYIYIYTLIVERYSGVYAEQGYSGCILIQGKVITMVIEQGLLRVVSMLDFLEVVHPANTQDGPAFAQHRPAYFSI